MGLHGASVVVSCGGEVLDDGITGLEMPGDVVAWRAHGRHRGCGEEHRIVDLVLATDIECVSADGWQSAW